MTDAARVTGVRSIELRVPDVAATAAFYEAAWGLAEVAHTATARYFRASGAEHHIVVVHQGDRGLARINLATTDRAAVDALYERLRKNDTQTLGDPAALETPGGGYGFAFVDREGRTFGISADHIPHRDAAHAPDRPIKLSHIVLNSDYTDEMSDTLTGLLGFRVRDRTRMMTFLGCNTDHHTIAFARFGGATVNHVAFDVPSIDALMRGAGRMKAHDYPIQWGVGRHGPGSNVFAYFIDPNEFAIEYTAEMEQVDDAVYHVGTPEEWGRRKSMDAWGLAEPPTARFQEVSGAAAHATR